MCVSGGVVSWNSHSVLLSEFAEKMAGKHGNYRDCNFFPMKIKES